MARYVGTVSRGIRTPIISEGDNLIEIVTDSLLKAIKEDNITPRDRDIVGVTEAVVARAAGNYATVDQIAKDVKQKFGDHTIGLIFPILSRNRFSIVLKGIARGAKKIVLMLSYPADEVGNHLISLEKIYDSKINQWSTLMDEKEYRELFGQNYHPFTHVDYVDYYKEIIQNEGCEVEVIFSNRTKDILKYTQYVLCADIHSRNRSKRILKNADAKLIYGLDDILNQSVDGSGYNEEYGVLGSNKATEEKIKLFPRDAKEFAYRLQASLLKETGKIMEVLVYGDGAFKDPQGQIWELADPVVSPGFTDGLRGLPNEIKLKYLADNQFADLKGEELKQAMVEYIQQKATDVSGQMVSQGTTPRQLTDLIGSLCDLTSGSGDKGTPVIYIQGYFDNYASE